MICSSHIIILSTVYVLVTFKLNVTLVIVVILSTLNLNISPVVIVVVQPVKVES